MNNSDIFICKQFFKNIKHDKINDEYAHQKLYSEKDNLEKLSIPVPNEIFEFTSKSSNIAYFPKNEVHKFLLLCNKCHYFS